MAKLKQCAIDTCFLIDLADKNPVALSSLQALHRHQYILLAPPTVLQELAYIATQSEEHDPKVKELALKALQSLRTWKIDPYNLIPAGHGLVEINGDALRRKGLIPEEERHDSFILIETSLLKGSLLITTNRDLLQINESTETLSRYIQFMEEQDLMPVVVIHPKEVIKRLGRISPKTNS